MFKDDKNPSRRTKSPAEGGVKNTADSCTKLFPGNQNVKHQAQKKTSFKITRGNMMVVNCFTVESS